MDTGTPQHFQMAEGHAIFRPASKAPLLQCIAMIGATITFARDQGIRNLLVDTIGLVGFKPPGVLDRVWMAHQFSAAAGSAIKVALVARAEFIHPQKIGVMVARNRGMITDVFSVESEALAWLLDPAAQ